MTGDDGRSDEGVVDWDVARQLTGGDEALLDELLELFPGEAARHLQAMRDAIEQDDGPSLTRAAHTLKSSARMFGAMRLAERALEMEALGRSESLADAPAGLEALEQATALVVEALNDPGKGG